MTSDDRRQPAGFPGRAPADGRPRADRELFVARAQRSSSLAAAVWAVPALAALLCIALARPPAPADAVPVAAAALEAERAPSSADSSATWPVPFATVDGAELVLPSRATRIVGFHEASYPVALPMTPVGTRLADDHPDAPGVADHRGAWHAVMGSRGRATGATSAADLVLPRGAEVLAPVTGTVVEARNYALYGRYADARLAIRPDAAPHLLVTVLHVTGLEVEVGDHVHGGVTPVATEATKFPFSSHVDAYSGTSDPHVHVEVKRP